MTDQDWKEKEFVERYNGLYSPADADFTAAAGMLELCPGDFLADFGCGDGGFLEYASSMELRAVGVDASPHQILKAREKLRSRAKVELINSSFLDFNPGTLVFTKGFSRKALHHLDNGQKAVFFKNIGPAFRPGALFLLEDGIFDFPRAELENRWVKLMSEAEKYYGTAWKAKRKDVEYCFRSEFPAGHGEWAAAMAAGGFKPLKRIRKCSFYGSILAVKSDSNRKQKKASECRRK